jgi:hypothetical protein
MTWVGWRAAYQMGARRMVAWFLMNLGGVITLLRLRR